MLTIVLSFLLFVKLGPDGEMWPNPALVSRLINAILCLEMSDCACYSGEPRFGKISVLHLRCSSH